MKSLLKGLAVVAAVVPALAFAQITNSKHDLSSQSTATTRAVAGQTDQTCIFCHTPHRALQQSLIWNRSATLNNPSFSGNTQAGTTLATTIVDKSKVCLGCHDGSVALGSVNNSNGATASFTMQGNVNGSNQLTGGLVIGSGGAMAGNHPISIPYPGASKGAVTYNSIASQAIAQTVTFGDFFASTQASCNTPTGICTTGTSGTNVTLYPNNGTDKTNPGIECGSCHDVHNKFGITYFLRVSIAQSALCKACHNK